MEITDVRVFPVDEEKLKAFVSIIIDDCFVVSDIKVISGSNGLFISMPSKRRKNGTFRDIAHPLNSETRKKIEDRILSRYREAVANEPQSGASSSGSEEPGSVPSEPDGGYDSGPPPDDETVA